MNKKKKSIKRFIEKQKMGEKRSKKEKKKR
jgi:hypothetical protein